RLVELEAAAEGLDVDVEQVRADTLVDVDDVAINTAAHNQGERRRARDAIDLDQLVVHDLDNDAPGRGLTGGAVDEGGDLDGEGDGRGGGGVVGAAGEGGQGGVGTDRRRGARKRRAGGAGAGEVGERQADALQRRGRGGVQPGDDAGHRGRRREGGAGVGA